MINPLQSTDKWLQCFNQLYDKHIFNLIFDIVNGESWIQHITQRMQTKAWPNRAIQKNVWKLRLKLQNSIHQYLCEKNTTLFILLKGIENKSE